MAKKKSTWVKQQERQALYASIVNDFDMTYGSEDKLGSWQRLCRDVGEKEGPSITQCRKILNKINVNIFDFLAATEAGRAVPRFSSLTALQEYTKSSKKVFPLALAKNPYLKGLLVHMHGPRR